RPGAGRNQIRAVAADATLARLLDTQAGTPLLMLQGQGMDQHGRPLEWFTTWHRAEQLVFDVDVSMGHESVHPRLQDAPVQAAPEPVDAVAPPGQDPLARAQALVAELSAELARLRGQP
uniref:UTRA domain-containing protein n=1 Tax=Achromobacter sp. TaxID=134375 RepID=UPI0028B08FD0